jgi:hypothetical protein
VCIIWYYTNSFQGCEKNMHRYVVRE